MIETLHVGSVPVAIVRSGRRTVELTVERDGSVVARVPDKARTEDLARLLRVKELWIHSALARRSQTPADGPQKHFVSGEGFFYLGRSYRLRILKPNEATEGVPALRLFQSKFLLRRDSLDDARDHFIRWYSKSGAKWLEGRLPELARRVGVSVKSFRIRELGYRWASCSDDGRLNFNWRVFLLPTPIITYLILHELCHLVEHNHSPKFWSEVRRVAPDHSNKEAWLQAHGAAFNI